MGFLITHEFPSRFLSGDELEGKATEAVIREIKKEMAFSRWKNENTAVLVVYFEGKDRGVRLGKERAMELCTILGSDDTDDWKGKKVKIYSQKKYVNKRQLNVLHFGQCDETKEELSKELDQISLNS